MDPKTANMDPETAKKYFLRDGVIQSMSKEKLIELATKRGYKINKSQNKVQYANEFWIAQYAELLKQRQDIQDIVDAHHKTEETKILEESQKPRGKPSASEPFAFSDIQFKNRIDDMSGFKLSSLYRDIYKKGNFPQTYTRISDFEYNRATQRDIDVQHEDGGRNYNGDPDHYRRKYLFQIYDEADYFTKQQISREVVDILDVKSPRKPPEYKRNIPESPRNPPQSPRNPPTATQAPVFNVPVPPSPSPFIFGRGNTQPPPGALTEDEGIKFTKGLDRGLKKDSFAAKQLDFEADTSRQLGAAEDIRRQAVVSSPRPPPVPPPVFNPPIRTTTNISTTNILPATPAGPARAIPAIDRSMISEGGTFVSATDLSNTAPVQGNILTESFQNEPPLPLVDDDDQGFVPGEQFPMPAGPMSQLGGGNVVGQSSGTNPVRLSQINFKDARASTYYKDSKYSKYIGKSKEEIIDILEGDIEFANIRITRLEGEIAVNKKLSDELNVSRDKQRELRDLEKQRHREALDKLTREKNKAEEDLNKVREQSDKNIGELIKANTELTSRQRRIEELVADNQRLVQENRSLTTTISSGSSETQALQQQITARDDQIAALQRKLNDNAVSQDRLAEEHAERGNELVALRSEMQAKEYEIGELENNIRQLQFDMNTLQDLYTRLENEKLEREDTIRRLVRELELEKQKKNVGQRMQAGNDRRRDRNSTMRDGSPSGAGDDDDDAGAGPAPRDLNPPTAQREGTYVRMPLSTSMNFEDYDRAEGEFMEDMTNTGRRATDNRLIVGRASDTPDEKSRTKIGRFLRDLNFIIIQVSGYNEEYVTLVKPLAIGDEPEISNYEDVNAVLAEMDVKWGEITTDQAIAKKLVQYALGYGLNRAEANPNPNNTRSNVFKLKATLKYAYKLNAFPFEYKRKDAQSEAKLKNVAVLPSSQGRVVSTDFGTLVVPGQSNYTMRREGLNYVVYSGGKRQSFGSAKDAQYFVSSGGFGRKTYGPVTERIFGTPVKNLSKAVY